MLHEDNKLFRTFIALSHLIQRDCIPETVQLVIHAHERTKPGHERKFNVPEASEVAALVFGEKYGALGIVLSLKRILNENGCEKMDRIRLGNRIYDLLCYPLLFPYGNDGWQSKLMHLDQRGKKTKVTPLKFYSCLLFVRGNDFNILILSSRRF